MNEIPSLVLSQRTLPWPRPSWMDGQYLQIQWRHTPYHLFLLLLKIYGYLLALILPDGAFFFDVM